MVLVIKVDKLRVRGLFCLGWLVPSLIVVPYAIYRYRYKYRYR